MMFVQNGMYAVPELTFENAENTTPVDGVQWEKSCYPIYGLKRPMATFPCDLVCYPLQPLPTKLISSYYTIQ